MADQMTTNQEFKQLKERHNLTVTQCALMLDCSEDGVKGWLRTEGAAGHRKTPAMALKLFKLMLSSQTDAEHPSG